MTNAAHHRRAGGNVWVRLVGPPAPVLTVDDDGDGIPERDRGRIFEPFRRLEAVADRPGSGLGLALVAQQAREHEAEVRIDASPAGGARVVVRFSRNVLAGASVVLTDGPLRELQTRRKLPITRDGSRFEDDARELGTHGLRRSVMTRAELIALASPPCHECGAPVQRIEGRWHLDEDDKWRPGPYFMVCADEHRILVEPLI